MASSPPYEAPDVVWQERTRLSRPYRHARRDDHGHAKARSQAQQAPGQQASAGEQAGAAGRGDQRAAAFQPVTPERYAELLWYSLPEELRPPATEKTAWMEIVVHSFRAVQEDERNVWKASIRLIRGGLPDDALRFERTADALREVQNLMNPHRVNGED
jgi:hypothetical protein